MSMGNFGETLKRERELREISLREIADATKINIRYLEALEHNRFETLPGGVFNKGFIRAYARFIGADSEALVDSYLQEMAARDEAAGGATAGAAQGLHRPAEAPRRRDPGWPDAAAARRGPSAPSGLPITFAEAGVAPPPGAAARHPPTEPGEPRPEGRRSTRALVVVVSLVGAAAAAFVLVLILQAARSRDRAEEASGDVAATGMPPSDEIPAMSPAVPPPVSEPGLGLPQETPGDEAGRDAVPAAAGPTASGDAHDASSASPAARASDAAVAPQARTPATPTPAAPPPSPSTPPRPAATGSAASPAAEPPAGMELRLEATAPVWVQVDCDGEDRINRSLQAGEGQTLRCLSLIRVSATDAGAVRLSVNGARCAPLGGRGMRVEGFAIHSDDSALICPPARSGPDARR